MPFVWQVRPAGRRVCWYNIGSCCL
jgi:hypothetical protein